MLDPHWKLIHLSNRAVRMPCYQPSRFHCHNVGGGGWSFLGRTESYACILVLIQGLPFNTLLPYLLFSFALVFPSSPQHLLLLFSGIHTLLIPPPQVSTYSLFPSPNYRPMLVILVCLERATYLDTGYQGVSGQPCTLHQ